MRGRRVGSALCLAVLAMAAIAGCSRGSDVRATPTVPLRMDGSGALPQNVVVVRGVGPTQLRHPPEQWIVDRVRQILPSSRTAPVEFAGLADGRIVEAECSATLDPSDDCGETGFVTPDALDVLGLEGIDRAISKAMGGLAFDDDAVPSGRLSLRVDDSVIDLRGVHGHTGYRWKGLPSVWIPNLQPNHGMVPLDSPW